MKLKHVSAGPFFTYAKLDREVPDGLTLLVGANGSGKSSFYEAACFALHGETVRGSRVKEGAAEARFEAAGELYHVKRNRTIRGTKLELRCGILELSGATPTETQAKIDRLVGDYGRWCASHVFARDLLAKFGLATDKERKALLESLLGLEQFDRALRLAKEEASQASQERAGHDTRIPLLGSRQRELEERRRELAARQQRPAGEVKAELGAVTLSHAEAKHLAEPRTRRLEEIQGQVAEASIARMRAEREHEAAHVAIKEIEHDIAHRPIACETCGRPFDAESRAEALERLRAKLAEARASEAPVGKLLLNLRAREGLLNEEFGELVEANREYLQSQQRLRDRHAALKMELAQAEAAQADVEALTDKIVSAGADVFEATFKRDEAAHRQEVARLCVDALGLKGARNLLLSRALAAIERGANAVLARLLPEVRVQLSGTVQQGDGKEVDKVGLLVEGAGGGEYRGCSGGQRVRIDIALLLALASMGGGDGLLVFDEVFDSLDKEGVERVAEYLQELSRQRQVVVISHDDFFISMFPHAAVWRARIGSDDFSELVDE